MPFCMFNHPFLFAAVAVVAIGVVVYELIEGNKRQQPTCGRRPPPNNPLGSPPDDSRRPPPSNRPRPPPNNPPGSPPDDSRRPPPSNRPTPPPNNPPGSPPDYSGKSPPGNNLRKRNINKTSSEENTLKGLKESKNQKDSKSDKNQVDSTSAVKVAPKISVENLSKTSSATDSQNNPDKKFDENNYCKNMLDKLTNDTKNVNENIKGESLSHNICEEESDSSESNLLPKGEEKVINQATTNENICNSKKPYKRKRKTKNIMEKSTRNHIDKKHDNYSDNSDNHEIESSSDSQSDNSDIFSTVKATKTSPIQQRHASKNTSDKSSRSQSSNLYPKLDFHPLSDLGSESLESLSLDEDEDKYKRDMLKALKNDLQNCEIMYNADNSVACSSQDIEKEKPSESKLCKGCEENHVNTRAYPCNHAYLCVDCAVKVFRLYKKCTICLQDVEEFLQFSL